MPKYTVELALCWPDKTWETAVVQVDSDDLPDADREVLRRSDGEIWEAACDGFREEHPDCDAVALGLYGYTEVEDGGESCADCLAEIEDEGGAHCSRCGQPLCGECYNGEL
jgi:hypothetical protein